MEINKYLAKIVMELHGLDLTQYDPSFLNKSIQRRLADTHCSSVAEYCNLLEQNNAEAAALVDSLKISYSDFFRNPLTFAVLEQLILPMLAAQMKHKGRKELRIWSAACAAGQEAYSLVILLEELKAMVPELNYCIFATDHAEAQVNAARLGRYPAAALNNLTLKRLKQWFTPAGNTYTVKPALKNHVDFSVFDLFSEKSYCPPGCIFGDFDLVVCANLLFYYKDEYRRIILNKAAKCLADGGYLVTGEAEREILTQKHYHEFIAQSAIFTASLPRH